MPGLLAEACARLSRRGQSGRLTLCVNRTYHYSMSYSAKAIANYFLGLADAEKKPISHLKIQKLVYIAHGWYLAIKGEPLVGDEYAEAWQYGPVFPSLYHEFKIHGSGHITEPAMDYVPGSQGRYSIFHTQNRP